VRSPGTATTQETQALPPAGTPEAPHDGSAPAAASAGQIHAPAPARSQGDAVGVQSQTIDEFLATRTLEELENSAIAAAPPRSHTNRTRAAHALGISVRTLQRKLSPQQPETRDTEEPVAHTEAAEAPHADPSHPSPAPPDPGTDKEHFVAV